MKSSDFLTESVNIKKEIMQSVKKHGGNTSDYFIRLTDQDKLGYSSKQHFGRTHDVGDPDYDPYALPRGQGRPALWFYPLDIFIKSNDIYAGDHPYVWLVRLKSTAWLQPVDYKTTQQQSAPKGKQRVGILTNTSGVLSAVFFKPGFDIIDRWYDYGKMHKRTPLGPV